MKIGVFGGTFDPIHIGHINIIKAAASSGILDEIVVIPSAIPPLKLLEKTSFSSYRYQMVHIALEHETFEIPVKLSDIELNRSGKSYTIDTIRELKTKYSNNDTIILIYGTDILYDIEKWFRPNEIMNECELLIFNRPGYCDQEIVNQIDVLKNKYGAIISRLNAKTIDISSTQIRENICKSDNSYNSFLTKEVKNFIEKNALYSYSTELGLISHDVFQTLIKYEQILYKLINTHRIIHSLNTMREAVRLANIFNGDIDKSAIAGLLHDCAKSVTTCKKMSKAQNNDQNNIDNTIDPNIEHAYFGKAVAIEYFNIDDADILNAIYFHTTSRTNSSLLEKIVYVADKIEPARNFPRINDLRKISYKNLDEGLFECLSDIIEVLLKENNTPHIDSLKAFEELNKVYGRNIHNPY